MDLIDSVPMSPTLEDNEWAVGDYCLVFSNPRIFVTPVPLTGQSGVFTIPPEKAEQICAQVNQAQILTPSQEFCDFLNANKLQPVARLQKRVGSYLGFSKLNDVVRVCDQGLQLKPRDPQLHLMRARARYELLVTGDLDKISDEDFEHELERLRDEFDSAVDGDSLNGLCYHWRAPILHLLGDAEQEARDLELGRALAPRLGWYPLHPKPPDDVSPKERLRRLLQSRIK